MSRPWALLLALALAGAGCDEGDKTPEGAARAFLQAADTVEPQKVYELLAPDTQMELQRRAKTATRQTGGRQRLKPSEMLILGLAKAPFEVARIELAAREGNRARVRLVAAKNKAVEELELVEVKGHWRVRIDLSRHKGQAPAAREEEAQ